MYAVGAGLKAGAAASRCLDAVRLLLNEGASVNGATGYGLSGLMLASASGRTDVIELLLERAADVMAASDIGLTAVVMAADKGHAAAVRLLLQSAADPNHRYANGKTPLMGAAALAHTAVVSELLEHKAHVNARAGDGQFPLMYAVEKGLQDGLVCPVEGSVEKPEAEATVEVLLRAAADPNLAGTRQRTPLHVCVESESIVMAALLLAAGASLDSPDEDGTTPLDAVQKQPGLLEAINSAVSSRQAAGKTGGQQPLASVQKLQQILRDCFQYCEEVLSCWSCLGS